MAGEKTIALFALHVRAIQLRLPYVREIVDCLRFCVALISYVAIQRLVFDLKLFMTPNITSHSLYCTVTTLTFYGTSWDGVVWCSRV